MHKAPTATATAQILFPANGSALEALQKQEDSPLEKFEWEDNEPVKLQVTDKMSGIEKINPTEFAEVFSEVSEEIRAKLIKLFSNAPQFLFNITGAYKGDQHKNNELGLSQDLKPGDVLQSLPDETWALMLAAARYDVVHQDAGESVVFGAAAALESKDDATSGKQDLFDTYLDSQFGAEVKNEALETRLKIYDQVRHKDSGKAGDVTSAPRRTENKNDSQYGLTFLMQGYVSDAEKLSDDENSVQVFTMKDVEHMTVADLKEVIQNLNRDTDFNYGISVYVDGKVHMGIASEVGPGVVNDQKFANADGKQKKTHFTFGDEGKHEGKFLLSGLNDSGPSSRYTLHMHGMDLNTQEAFHCFGMSGNLTIVIAQAPLLRVGLKRESMIKNVD